MGSLAVIYYHGRAGRRIWRFSINAKRDRCHWVGAVCNVDDEGTRYYAGGLAAGFVVLYK